jgi:hypothetical protein
LANAAFRLNQPPGFFRPLRYCIDQRDLCAVPRKNDRGGAAVADAFGARSSPGDNGDLAFEAIVAANVVIQYCASGSVDRTG